MNADIEKTAYDAAESKNTTDRNEKDTGPILRLKDGSKHFGPRA